jgi:hypothetical protein
MEWLKIVAPLIGVAIGWALSEYGKVWADQKQDKKKIKKLIFFLMELRFQIVKSLVDENEIFKYLQSARETMQKDFGPEATFDIKQLGSMLKTQIKDFSEKEFEVEYLEKNIDQAVLELSEVYPIFAYELNGQYKIKDRLNRLDKYLEDVEEWVRQMPFDFKDWVQPKITKDLIIDIDLNLRKLAKKIDRTTVKNVNEKIIKQDQTSESSDIKIFLNDFFLEIQKNI